MNDAQRHIRDLESLIYRAKDRLAFLRCMVSPEEAAKVDSGYKAPNGTIACWWVTKEMLETIPLPQDVTYYVDRGRDGSRFVAFVQTPFECEGTLLIQLGTRGTGEHGFWFPHGAEVTHRRELHVFDGVPEKHLGTWGVPLRMPPHPETLGSLFDARDTVMRQLFWRGALRDGFIRWSPEVSEFLTSYEWWKESNCE